MASSWTTTKSGPSTRWPTTTPFSPAVPRWCATSSAFPPDAKGPLTVTARVNYRHLRQSYLNNVFGPDHPAYPVVELASRTRTLNIGDNPAIAAGSARQSRLDALEQSGHRVSGSTAVCRRHARLRAGREAAARLCGRLHQHRPDQYRVGEIFARRAAVWRKRWR